MQKEFKGRTERPPLWSKNQFLEDLSRYRNIKNVCTVHANDLGDGNAITWRGLYNDVFRWKRSDSKFRERVISLVGEGSGGRPPKDGGDRSWEDEFCKVFYDTSGDIGKAASVTPYSIRQIFEFADPESTSFRKDFADKLNEAKLRIVGELQSMFLSQRLESAFEDEKAANIAQRKAWISLKGLEKLYPTVWGRKSELNVQGKIQHLHSPNRNLLPEDRLAQLWEERKQYFERRQTETLQLADGVISKKVELAPVKEDVIEAEVVASDDEEV